MKTTKLLDAVERLGLRLPESGSGRNGRILSSDLENVIATHYARQYIERREAEGVTSHGFSIRRALGDVQLAARFDQLKPAVQAAVLDSDAWALEEKYDGCRIVLCYHPEEGFTAFGRNKSVQTFLPVEYTNKILIPVRHAGLTHFQPLTAFSYIYKRPFILDCEVLTEGLIEHADGYWSASHLNAVTALLAMDAEESRALQRTDAPLQIVPFDILNVEYKGSADAPVINTAVPFQRRREELVKFCNESGLFKPSELWLVNKRQRLEALLNSGKEGGMLKNLRQPYRCAVARRRYPDTCIKYKRTMTYARANDIDAYVIGYTLGDEYTPKGLIAGLKLGVQLVKSDGTVEQDYWIATVSGLPLELRRAMSHMDSDGKVILRPEYYGRVVTVDGQDISGRNRRISHARIDWEIGFRIDKRPEDCLLDEDFMDSQIF